MPNESEIIKSICSILPKKGLQVNKPFESDAEILEYGGKYLLVTTDGFSKEDRFRENDASVLGYNIAVAAISDILACGGKPLFYTHSMVISEKWNAAYIENFTKGVKEALEYFDLAFIGGDLGTANEWNYTATIIGETDRALMRKGAKPDDTIFISGSVGAGNLEAVLNLYADKAVLGFLINKFKTKFNIRLSESKLVKKFASSCIDTSDGLNKSLQILSEINNTGFEIENIPYSGAGLKAAKLLGKPVEMLMLGECGEYELLFSVPPQKLNNFLQESQANKLEFYKIGTITQNKNRRLKKGNKILDLNFFNFSAREFKNIKEYIAAQISLLEKSWITIE